MKKYLWLTDIHLNFLNKKKLEKYITYLNHFKVNGILISGDVSTGNTLEQDLEYFAQGINCPIYFTLGNHDFYSSSFSEIECKMIALQYKYPEKIKYLDIINEPIALNSEIGLVGQTGWYDASWSEPLTSLVFWYDCSVIKEFRSCSIKDSMGLIRDKANEETYKAIVKLKLALQKYSTVYFLTHFPPWPEATYYNQGLLGKFWVPYSSCKVLADNLVYLMQDYPDQKLIVLCGHVHHRKMYYPAPNIEVQVGASSFGEPGISGIVYA